MHCLAVLVAFGIVFGFSVATELQGRDDTSLDIFSDPGWSDLENSNLSLNDDDIFEDPYSDPLLASACDAGSDSTLPSKLRARDNDNGFCLNKSPTPPTLSWPSIPNIFKKIFQPKEPPEQFGPVPNNDGTEDKCWPPFFYNLCCEGDLFGVDSLDPSIGSLIYYSKIENCYASMRFKMLPPVQRSMIGC